MTEVSTVDLMWGVEFEPAEVTFKYADIERAIASIHNINPEAFKTLRSRIKHFQRIGLVPSSPGKGQKIKYTVGDAIRWALCFELAECGLPPEQIKDVIRICGYKVFGAFSKLNHPITPTEDLIFVLSGNFLQWHLDPSERPYSELFIDATVGVGSMTCGVIAVSKLQDQVFAKAKMQRAILVNMSALRRNLALALKIEWR